MSAQETQKNWMCRVVRGVSGTLEKTVDIELTGKKSDDFSDQTNVSLIPQSVQYSEYAVLGTTGAPKISEKSDNLVDYIETKPFNVADKKLEVSDGDGGGGVSGTLEKTTDIDLTGQKSDDCSDQTNVSPKPNTSTIPQSAQDSEYAVLGTTGAPKIPEKSDNLVDYLETKPFNVADKKPEVSVNMMVVVGVVEAVTQNMLTPSLLAQAYPTEL